MSKTFSCEKKEPNKCKLTPLFTLPTNKHAPLSHSSQVACSVCVLCVVLSDNYKCTDFLLFFSFYDVHNNYSASSLLFFFNYLIDLPPNTSNTVLFPFHHLQPQQQIIMGNSMTKMEKMEKQLRVAARDNNEKMVKCLSKKGLNFDAKDAEHENGMTALIIASAAGQVGEIELL